MLLYPESDRKAIELEKEQGERKASEHAVSTLKRHLTSVREKCRTFDVEVEQYRAIKSNLSRGVSHPCSSYIALTISRER